jgi:serine racemase
VRQPPTNAPTLADGLRAGIGAITLPLLRDHVDGVITVTESEISEWMRFAFERLKLVIEPSAAVGVAAIRSPTFKAMAKQAACAAARSSSGLVCPSGSSTRAGHEMASGPHAPERT